MRVLLDTQAFYIASGVSESTFSSKVAKLLEDAETERILSAASIMEIAIKNAKGLISLNEDQVQTAVFDLRLTIISFEPRHAYRLFSLAPHHRDPFDRMLIATALEEGIPLVGGDREFQKYRGLKVIW